MKVLERAMEALYWKKVLGKGFGNRSGFFSCQEERKKKSKAIKNMAHLDIFLRKRKEKKLKRRQFIK